MPLTVAPERYAVRGYRSIASLHFIFNVMEMNTMAAKRVKPGAYVKHHRDGSVWARGHTTDGVATGYWEWFRKDGVRMREGQL